MAVLVTKAEGHKKKFADTEGKRFSHRTTDADVLRVVQTEGGKQTLTQEYSPAVRIGLSSGKSRGVLSDEAAVDWAAIPDFVGRLSDARPERSGVAETDG